MIIAWIFIAVIGLVLLACTLAPFILSGRISQAEERMGFDEETSQGSAIGPSRTRIAEKAREAAEVPTDLQGTF